MTVENFDKYPMDHYETITPEIWLDAINVGKGKRWLVSETLRRFVRWAVCRIHHLQRENEHMSRRLRELGYPQYEE